MTILLKNSSRKRMIDRNVAKRQKLKNKWDRHCKYGVEEQETLPSSMVMFSHEVEAAFAQEESQENWIRMLDEGTVVDGDGFCYAVIKKGVLKTFYENLSDDFEGYIDRDHIQALRLGTYTKKDLRLVELGNDRYGIDVNVKLDKDYYTTRDLLRQGEHRAVSVEMHIDIDEFGLASKVTKDKSQGEYLIPLIGAVDIVGYAVCENPKNANSIKDDLLDKASVEGEDMNEEELKKLQAEKTAEAERTTEKNDADADADAEAEITTEGGAEKPEVFDASKEGEGAEDGAKDDAEKAENAEANEEEKSEDKAEDELAIQEGLEQLKAAITELRAELTAKDAKIAELENQLTAKAEKKMSTTETIANLLNFARGVEATAAEGSEVKTPSDEAENKYAADDALWDEAAKSLNY